MIQTSVPPKRANVRTLDGQPALVRGGPRLDLLLETAVRQGPGQQAAPPTSAISVTRIATARAATTLRPIGARANRILRPMVVRAVRQTKPLLSPAAFRFRSFLSAPALSVVIEQLHHSTAFLGHRIDVLAEQLQATQAAVELVSERSEVFAANREELSRGDQLEPQVAELQRQLAAARGELEPAIGRLHDLVHSIARRVVVPIADGVLLVRANVGYVLCPAGDDVLVTFLIDSGELEYGTRTVIERVLTPGDTYVDIGAHIGLHVLAAAGAVGETGALVAVEPHHDTCRLLRRTLALNGLHERATVHELALSNEAGEAELYLGKVSGHHSLHPLDVSLRQQGGESVKVEVATLDSIFEPTEGFVLVKIDAEGEEINILEGMASLFETQADLALVVEFGPTHLRRVGIEPSDWLARFEDFGLRWRVIGETTGRVTAARIEELVELDSVNLLFARPDSRLWNRL